MSYYEMVMNGYGNCDVDALGSSGTLTASTEYATSLDQGATTDPCGYYIMLEYEATSGTGIQGVYQIFRNNGKIMGINVILIVGIVYSILFQWAKPNKLIIILIYKINT